MLLHHHNIVGALWLTAGAVYLSTINGPIENLHFLRNKLNAGPMTSPTCLVDINIENTPVRCCFDVVLASSPNRTAPPDIPNPGNRIVN